MINNIKMGSTNYNVSDVGNKIVMFILEDYEIIILQLKILKVS